MHFTSNLVYTPNGFCDKRKSIKYIRRRGFPISVFECYLRSYRKHISYYLSWKLQQDHSHITLDSERLSQGMHFLTREQVASQNERNCDVEFNQTIFLLTIHSNNSLHDSLDLQRQIRVLRSRILRTSFTRMHSQVSNCQLVFVHIQCCEIPVCKRLTSPANKNSMVLVD